ncbi:hypothetical protein ANACAC_02165 [Anaerostipes caccae L1-92]|uniref:Uncharacterized protein n=1 Tax=Anaerostipes caccae (strain DSM 14662 / CCUG 47493 / JCM 13470 / NCIMB 13811 / L1-92) TaxID=411490 RepID=B0MFR7_ANACD|nr:hypothetical protein ANACAC_02165 [Anaerostipes caccae L1-92]
MIIEFFLLENKMDICLDCCNAVNKKDLYPTTRIQVLKMNFTDDVSTGFQEMIHCSAKSRD